MALSRRQLFKTTLTAGTAFGTVAFATRLLGQATPPADSGGTSGNQVSKQVAQYQDKPNGQQSCSQCANFMPPSGCKLVTGPVSPSGWCKLFQPKSS